MSTSTPSSGSGPGTGTGSSLIRALAYLRVSGLSQVDGDGFIRQREAIDSYAARHNIRIIQEYRDNGVSGARSEREGIAATLLHCEQAGVKLVLVEGAHRFARDYMAQEIILQKFRDIGVQVIESDGGFDLTAADAATPTQRLIRQVLAAVSEFDKDSTVLKLKAARDRVKQRTGRCGGNYQFGHHPDKPDEADALRFILEMYNGHPKPTMQSILLVLKDSRFKTRTGKPWTLQSVVRIINRETKRKPQPELCWRTAKEAGGNNPLELETAVSGTNGVTC